MTMWVFGYGSLIWNPGFEYLDSKIGYIKGFNRRFWQGNDFHRGNPNKMGRVATLVEDEQGLTWGKAFLLGPGAESALNYLDKRESKLGGYCTTVVTFQPRFKRRGLSSPTLHGSAVQPPLHGLSPLTSSGH
ncbi:glutathione-specific gamma-glutamylcyclotransferase 1 [Trichonephila inaurata madagascariensis]|uniref:glutathione-specific gamma-glutamylcyclotransferase n=1 Tax=Trichonephila inaurata madagascariensis TaxID=2747483 RepID=A0A8X6ILK1_9ARAC|nr:glutathione-specific gamma-glutamylcyclotransferase 1 [Trichonephila inaurata madagascariensis]